MLFVSAAKADEIRTDDVVFSCYFIIEEIYEAENKWNSGTTKRKRKVNVGPLFVTEDQLNDVNDGIAIVVKASGKHVRIPGGSGYSCFGAI
jgi:predicted ThiF/HesA family dinucleotide-utilizing enzyme